LPGALKRLVGPTALFRAASEGLRVVRSSTEAGRGSGVPLKYSRGLRENSWRARGRRRADLLLLESKRGTQAWTCFAIWCGRKGVGGRGGGG
jgi:hypothetical protein